MPVSILSGFPECERCETEYDPSWTWSSRQGGYVSSWECPSCGLTTMREVEGEVEVRPGGRPLPHGPKRSVVRRFSRLLR